MTIQNVSTTQMPSDALSHRRGPWAALLIICAVASAGYYTALMWLVTKASIEIWELVTN